jgi:hypothetical protein
MTKRKKVKVKRKKAKVKRKKEKVAGYPSFLCLDFARHLSRHREPVERFGVPR